MNPNFENTYQEIYSITFNVVSGRSSDGKLIDMRLLLHSKVNSFDEVSKNGSYFEVKLRNGYKNQRVI